MRETSFCGFKNVLPYDSASLLGNIFRHPTLHGLHDGVHFTEGFELILDVIN